MRRWRVVFLMGILSFSVAFSSEIMEPGCLDEVEIEILQDRSNVFYTPEDQKIFQRFIHEIIPWQSSPFDKILEKTALFFLNKPYVAHTLEVQGEERLVVNLREFDCTTFVETVIALARSVQSGKTEFDNFISELRQIRYRDGMVDGYASRLHYTSDWLFDNEKKGILKNMSAELGGMLEKKTINFMGTHRSAYRQLNDDEMLWKEMMKMENEINKRGGFYYLPKAYIATQISEIPHMSVVAFTTNINGLDVMHLGFMYKADDRHTFVHASSAHKKVVIDPKTLSDYCTGQSSCTGIIVSSLHSCCSNKRTQQALSRTK